MAKYLQPESVNCIVTSPPYYGLRDYGVDGQIGLEQTPQEFVDKLVAVFRECKKVLREDGTLWLNLGDSYYNYRPGKGQALVKQSCASSGQDLPQTCARRGNKLDGLKEKDLIGIPWRVAFALQADGWYLRQDIVWHKPNPMPESVKDRCTKAHEYIFLLSKNPKYYFDSVSIQEDAKWERWGDQTVVKEQQGTAKWIGAKSKADLQAMGKKNKRSVWTVATKPCKEAHFATFPTELIRPCVKAGCPIGGIVLDPFMGAGTTALVAKQEGRQYVGFELNPAYVDMANKRLFEHFVLFFGTEGK